MHFGRSSVQRLNQLKYTQAAWATDIKPLPMKDKRSLHFLSAKERVRRLFTHEKLSNQFGKNNSDCSPCRDNIIEKNGNVSGNMGCFNNKNNDSNYNNCTASSQLI